MSLSYNYPPQMAYPSAPPVYRGLPAPPRLHWGWVLALSIVTFGVFGMVWLVVIGWWVKKATGNARPFWWCIAYLTAMPVLFMAAVTLGGILGLVHQVALAHQLGEVIGIVTRIALFVLYVTAAFTLKGSLEAHPIDIPLGGVMTFLFAPIYFQYNLYDYSVEGRVGAQLSGFEQPVVVVAPVVAEMPEAPPQA